MTDISSAEMKRDRPAHATTWSFTGERMMNRKDGPWVKRTHFEAWRDYALALELKLKQVTPTNDS